MPNTYFTSDLHDGHRAIGKYRSGIIPEIVDAKTNREYIGDNWRATSKHDTVIITGDVFFAPDSHIFIGKLAGHKKFFLGNHDLQNNSCSSLSQIMSVCDSVTGIEKRKYFGGKYWVTHAPMHPSELRGCGNIHGHIHSTHQDYMNKNTPNYDARYININLDVLFPRTGKIMIDVNELDEYRKGFYVDYSYMVVGFYIKPNNQRQYTFLDYYPTESEAKEAKDSLGGYTHTYKVQTTTAQMFVNTFLSIPLGKPNGNEINQLLRTEI